MHHNEIISQFLEQNQKILCVGTADKIAEHILTSPFFQSIDPIEINAQITDLANDFDTVIFSDALEKINNPRELIAQIKWHAKSSIVYEFKYDHMETVDPSWKQPWKTIGLENILTWEFDYVKSIYLGYATIFFCEGPNKFLQDQLVQSNQVEQH